MWKNIMLSVGIMAVTAAAMTASTLAAFTAQATVSGITFSTGHAALKLFGNLGYTNAGNNGNLTTKLPGVHFEGIGPDWSDDYRLKYFNTGSVNLLTSLTVNIDSDDANLADHIMVETWLWNDLDKDGNDDPSDGYTLLGAKQSIASLQSNPVDLGQLDTHEPRGLVLRFSTEDMPSSTQDEEADIDFVIQGTTQGATQE